MPLGTVTESTRQKERGLLRVWDSFVPSNFFQKAGKPCCKWTEMSATSARSGLSPWMKRVMRGNFQSLPLWNEGSISCFLLYQLWLRPGLEWEELERVSSRGEGKASRGWADRTTSPHTKVVLSQYSASFPRQPQNRNWGLCPLSPSSNIRGAVERGGKEPRRGSNSAEMGSCPYHVLSAMWPHVNAEMSPRWALVSWFVKCNSPLIGGRPSTWKALDTATVIWHMVWNSTNASLPWNKHQQRQDFLPLLPLARVSWLCQLWVLPRKTDSGSALWIVYLGWFRAGKRALSGGVLCFPCSLGSQESQIIQSGFFDTLPPLYKNIISAGEKCLNSSPKRQPFPEDCVVCGLSLGDYSGSWKSSRMSFIYIKLWEAMGLQGEEIPAYRRKRSRREPSPDSGQTEPGIWPKQSAGLAVTKRSCGDF